jgi:type III pantothenate kinase
MRLWIDIGNTCLKWQVCHGDELVSSGRIKHQGNMLSATKRLKNALESTVPNLKLEFVGLASVLNASAMTDFQASFAKIFAMQLSLAKVQRSLKGVTCAYQEINKLGIDRWLAIVAAFSQRQQAACVIDCGSAITIDMVNNAGEHLGGFILPGLNMSIQALLGQTHSVRFDELLLPSSVSLGRDTRSGVQNGVLFQAQSSLKEAWELFSSLVGRESEDGLAFKSSESLFLTGGDAERVAKGLSLDCNRQDDLVIQGLKLALE